MGESRLHRISSWRRSRACRYVEDVQDSKETRLDSQEASNHRSPIQRVRSNSRSLQQRKDGRRGVEIAYHNCKGIEDPKASRWKLDSQESPGVQRTSLEGVRRGDSQSDARCCKTRRLIGRALQRRDFCSHTQLHATGAIDRKDSVVVIATGSGLKTLEQF